MVCLRVILLTCASFQVVVWCRKSPKDEGCLLSEQEPSTDPEWILLQGNLLQQHDPFATARRGFAAVDSSGDTDDVSEWQVHQLVDEVDDGISTLRQELKGAIVDLHSLVESPKNTRTLSMAAAPRSNLVLNSPDLDEELMEVNSDAMFRQHPPAHGGHGAPPKLEVAHGGHGAPPPAPPAAPPPPAHGAPPPPQPSAHGAPPAAPPAAHGAPPAPPADDQPPGLPQANAGHMDLTAPAKTEGNAGHIDLAAPAKSMAAAPSPAAPAGHGAPPAGHGAPPAPAPPPPKKKRAAAAPNPTLVKEAIEKERKKKELEASGDLHYTQHGCHCLVDWEYREVQYKGCSATPGSEHTDHAWCKVTPGCEKHKSGEEEGDFDLCNVPGETDHHLTMHGCHCAPEWFWKDTLYEGCGKTSLGPSWCYVFESDALCEGALRTEHAGQHWDYCNFEHEASPILTKGGCHCQPEWVHSDGNHYHGCVASTADRDFPWCFVFEDLESCPSAKKDEKSGRLWDACWLLDEAQIAALDLTKNNCHCEPEWDHKGVMYKGCSKTPDREKKWCYVLEDNTICTEVAGFGEGLEKFARWDYCGEDEQVPALPGSPPTYKLPPEPVGNTSGGVLPKHIWQDKDFPKDGAWSSCISFSLLLWLLFI